MNKSEKRSHMLSMVDEWKSSGLTQKVFCSLHGIKVATLGYWVCRSREVSASPESFIRLSPPLAQGSAPVEIIYPSGVRLKVAGELSLIARLIHL